MPSKSMRRESRQATLEEFCEKVREKGGEFFIYRTNPEMKIPEEVFVDRVKELDILSGLFDDASKMERGGLVVPIVGESGRGKSTLCNYFAQQLLKNDIKVFKIPAREFLLQEQSIGQKIASYEGTKFVYFDHLEDLFGDVEKIMGALKYWVQNRWHQTLVCFTATDRFYIEQIKRVMDIGVSYKVFFEEIPDLKDLKPFSSDNLKRAIKKWTEYESQKLLGKRFDVSQFLTKNALESLTDGSKSLGDVFKDLDYLFKNITPKELPLDVDAFAEEVVKLPKIIIATTYDEIEVDRLQNGIRTERERFFYKSASEKLKDLKDVPDRVIKKMLDNLEIIHLEDDVIVNVLYYSQIFASYKDLFKLKDEDLDIYSNTEKLNKQTAIRLLKESALYKILYPEEKRSKIVPLEKGKHKLINAFNKQSRKKSTIGTNAFLRVLRCAGFVGIPEEVKRSIRIDITLVIDDVDYALEFAFHTKTGRLKTYTVGKIAKYYENYLK